jgi:hypothetical protein
MREVLERLKRDCCGEDERGFINMIIRDLVLLLVGLFSRNSWL